MSSGQMGNIKKCNNYECSGPHLFEKNAFLFNEKLLWNKILKNLCIMKIINKTSVNLQIVWDKHADSEENGFNLKN